MQSVRRCTRRCLVSIKFNVLARSAIRYTSETSMSTNAAANACRRCWTAGWLLERCWRKQESGCQGQHGFHVGRPSRQRQPHGIHVEGAVRARVCGYQAQHHGQQRHRFCTPFPRSRRRRSTQQPSGRSWTGNSWVGRGTPRGSVGTRRGSRTRCRTFTHYRTSLTASTSASAWTGTSTRTGMHSSCCVTKMPPKTAFAHIAQPNDTRRSAQAAN